MSLLVIKSLTGMSGVKTLEGTLFGPPALATLLNSEYVSKHGFFAKCCLYLSICNSYVPIKLKRSKSLASKELEIEAVERSYCFKNF